MTIEAQSRDTRYEVLNTLHSEKNSAGARYIPTKGFCFLINLFIYLFLAALGLHCCSRAFSSCGKWGLVFIAVRGLLTAVASLVVEHRLQACGLQ